MSKISTPVKSLDTALGGGFTRGTLNLIVGPVGSGKITLLRQGIDAALQQGLSVYYMAETRPPREWEAPRRHNRLTIWTGYGDATTMGLQKALDGKPDLLAIDSLRAPPGDGFEGWGKLMRLMGDLTGRLNLTVVTTMQTNRSGSKEKDLKKMIRQSMENTSGGFEPAAAASTILVPVRDDAKKLGVAVMKARETKTGGWFF